MLPHCDAARRILRLVIRQGKGMYVMTIKACLLIIGVLTVLRAVGGPPMTDQMIVFIAGGVVPWTGVVIPPDIILVTTALAVMMLFGWLFHLYTRHQAKMRLLVPRYKVKRQDPAYSTLVPGLGKALALGRTVRLYAKNAPRQLYFWLKYLGHPARAQAVIIRAKTVISRLHVRLPERARLQRGVLFAMIALRRWSDRARAYILRVTTF